MNSSSSRSPRVLLGVAAALASLATPLPAADMTIPASADAKAVGQSPGVTHTKLYEFDTFGTAQYSHYNFTDVKIPYDGVDAWALGKFSINLIRGSLTNVRPEDANRAWGTTVLAGPYFEGLISGTSADEFFWQRYLQGGAGLQLYPFALGKERTLRPIRFFGLFSARWYYDEPDGVDVEDTNVSAGADYYFDNINVLPKEERWAVFAYANASWQSTNFAFDGYDGFTSTVNLKVGPKMSVGTNGVIVPYALLDMVWSPSHDERWWENSLKLGGGIAYYPFVGKYCDKNQVYTPKEELRKRFHIFVDVLHNVSWLGSNAPGSVRETDVRVGLSYSTGGFTRDVEP